MTEISKLLAEAERMLDSMREIRAEFASMTADGRFGRLDTLGRTIAAFALPLDVADDAEGEEGSMALLRAFERHGDGLRPYAPADPVEPGDVLIASDRTVWIVDRIDDQGDISSVVGGSPNSKGELRLRWRPSPAARRWIAAGQVAGPAYRDPEEALSSLALLWGRTESETRSFNRPEALFWQLADTPGVRFSRAGLEDEADEKMVRTWLASRGASGAEALAALMPGDVVWAHEEPGFSIVLRAEGGLADTIRIDRKSKGPMGEPRGSAQISRAIAFGPSSRVWRPG